MKIHEYQAKEILRAHGVAVPRGKLVQSAEEAVAAARELMASGNGVVVVKAQIHAGGRGKGGGVKLARSPEEAGEIFKKMLGMQLVTHQTGAQGQKVRKVYVEEGCDIARELYTRRRSFAPGSIRWWAWPVTRPAISRSGSASREARSTAS